MESFDETVGHMGHGEEGAENDDDIEVENTSDDQQGSGAVSKRNNLKRAREQVEPFRSSGHGEEEEEDDAGIVFASSHVQKLKYKPAKFGFHPNLKDADSSAHTSAYSNNSGNKGNTNKLLDSRTGKLNTVMVNKAAAAVSVQEMNMTGGNQLNCAVDNDNDNDDDDDDDEEEENEDASLESASE